MHAVIFLLLSAARPEPVVTRVWTEEDGLPVTCMRGVARTSDGYIWATCEGGLLRFDGVRFLNVAPRVGFSQLARPGPDGALVGLSMHGRVMQFARDSVSEVVPGRDGREPSKVLQDRNGRIWVVLDNELVSTVGGAMTPTGVRGVFGMDASGNILAAHDGQVTTWESSEPPVPLPADVRAVTALGGAQAALVVGTADSAWTWNREDASWGHSPVPGGVVAVSITSLGHPWVLTPTEIVPWSVDGPGHALTIAGAYAVEEDEEHGVWVAAEHGLVRYGPATATTYTSPDAPHGTPIGSLILTQGTVVAGGTNGQLYQLRERELQRLYTSNAGEWVLALQHGDSAEEVWALFRQSARGDSRLVQVALPSAHLARAVGTPLSPQLTEATADSSSLARVGPDHFLVAGRRGVVELRNGASQPLPGFFAASRVFNDNVGDCWASSDTALARFHAQEREDLERPPERMRLATRDTAGRTWLAGPSGIFLRTAGGYRQSVQGARVGFTTAYGMVEDDQHRLWWTSNEGLFVASLDRMAQAGPDGLPEVEVRKLGRADGLPAHEFNGGQPALLKDEAGHLWAAHTRGLLMVFPELLGRNTLPPPARIERVRAGTASIPGGASVVLPPGTTQVAIEYTGFAYSAPEQLTFQYRLDEVDPDWTDALGRRTAYYTDLSPGTRRFAVRARSMDGVWSAQDAVMDLTIQPWWWQTQAFMCLCAALALSALFGLYRWRVRALVNQQRVLELLVAQRTASLEHERSRSESLLLNVLPAPISARLKQAEGTTIVDAFDEVTILFADIVGFTPLSTRVSPAELVSILNDVFTRFDVLAERHGTEKIKTIGDAYMVVAGVPNPRSDHADALASMALEMRDAIVAVNTERGLTLQVRMGMNTGPVVAGVIGRRKFSYDLWGDAVNTASRMESHGSPGHIHISKATRDRLGPGFVVEPRGVLDIKGKGPMETWFLTGRN